MRGWTNVDSHELADVRGDIRKLTFSDVDEVLMSHVLEHLSYHDVIPTLRRIRSWMKPDAAITIEVPNMRVIGPAVDNPWWLTHTYGLQSHPGEYHRSGFTETTLENALAHAGFHDITSRVFDSENEQRPGMPCLEAKAKA